MTASTRPAPIAALRAASRIARGCPDLARLERDKPGHGAAELARRVKDACPDQSKAASRRAADHVLEARLARADAGPRHVTAGGVRYLDGRRLTPSRALGRTPTAVPPLADRLRSWRQDRAIEALNSAGLRLGPGGDIQVRFGAPAIAVRAETEWRSGRRGYGYVTTDTHVTLTVPEDWGTQVRLRGLALCDGLMTLDALALPTDGDVEVYRAAWLRQGRGYWAAVEHGHLARHTPSGTTYHSAHPDPERALSGLRRKLRALAIPAAERDARRAAAAESRRRRKESALARLVARVAAWDLAAIAHVPVTLADSYRAGNCEPGTLAFRDRYLPGRGSATIGEIAAAVGRIDPASLAGADLALARQLAAACLVAIRRDRAARRLVTA